MENKNNNGRNMRNDVSHGGKQTARGADRAARPVHHAQDAANHGTAPHNTGAPRYANGAHHTDIRGTHRNGTVHPSAPTHQSGAHHATAPHHGGAQHHGAAPHHDNAHAMHHPTGGEHKKTANAHHGGTPHPAQSARRAKTLRGGRQRKTGYTLLISLVVFLAVLLVVGLVLWRIIDTYEPTVDIGPQGNTPSTNDAPAETGDPDLENPPLYASTTIARKSGFYTMLLVGHDAVAVNTDVIMLVSFDVEGGALSIMQIPRDTYIETNGRARKINSVYGLMRDDSISDKTKRIASGMDGLADVIEEGIGIPIDFWAIIDLDGFDGIIDAIGGVEMDVPYDMDYEDPEQDLYIHLKKGLQTLDGEEAEQFVRFRDSYAMGDIGRVDAQKLFMSALFNQLKENLTVSGVAKLAEKTIPLVNTNMKLLDCIYFGKNFIKGVDFDKITFVTLPGESARENGTTGLSYYVMRRSDMLQLVNAYFNPYTTDLTENSIDRLQIFNSEDNEFISKVYLAPSIGMENLIHGADAIMDGELDIAITGN